MNNPFWKTTASRLLYAGIWVMIIVAQILLLEYYLGGSGTVYTRYIVYDSLIAGVLQAVCLLVLWYPVQYYRHMVRVSLFLVFHGLLFVLSSVIWLGAGYFILQAGFDAPSLYPDFFLQLLPARLFFGLSVYILFVLAYYLFLANEILREQKAGIAETGAMARPAEKLSRISVK
ncbi:MAG: hypothetical protein LBB64_05215, partial [Dysgonamonadaceae bacterium]|nr:hypothetical protein [Dysgonamonadaceae bacterium]